MHDKLTVTSKTSQSLICASELAQVTRRYHKILSAARASLDEAIEIGGILLKIKAKLGHGNWLPWAEKKLPFSLRRAEYWMSLFENRQDRKFANASNLSSAYKLLAGPIIDVESEVLPLRPVIWPDETRETIAAMSGKERSSLYLFIMILEREPGFVERMEQLLDDASLAEFKQLREAA